MKIISYIFLVLTLTTTLPASESAMLDIDTRGHTGIIKSIIVTKNKDFITASNDKSIRVWDSKTGKEKRKILGQTGSGSEGMIFAMSLSSDEKYLAVSGYFDDTMATANSRHGRIRIYDYVTGKLVKVLTSHTSVVFGLSFSEDDRYLISGSADKTAKIWDVKNDFALKDTIIFHKNDIYVVKIIKKQGSYYAVTAGYDSKIAFYDMDKKKIVKSDESAYKLQYSAVSKDNIALCGYGHEILIYDYSFNLIQTIKTDTKSSGLAYSEDGKLLIAGTGSSPYNVNIYDAKNSYVKTKSFKQHTNLTMAVGFLDNNTVVSAGGGNKEIYIWDINTKKTIKSITGVGKLVWSVGINGDEIAFGNIFDAKGDYHVKQSSFQRSINLKNFTVNGAKEDSYYKRISTINGSYSLVHKKGGFYGYKDGILDIKKDNKVVASIEKDATTGLQHYCYGWHKDFIISGGSGGLLKIYTKDAKEVADLVGHTGVVWSAAIDGDRMVTGSSDQTMRLWDLSKLKPNTKNQILEPILNIFVAKDNEWVVWSKSGYFNSSVGGDKYVGYHINQGDEHEARYVGSDKYFDTLYRPDIISTILQTNSEKKAIAYVNTTKKVKKVNISSSLPPVVSLLSDSKIKTSQDSIKIEFSVSSKEDIKEIIVLHNGERINSRGLKKKKDINSKRVTIDLVSGENIISIKARNKFAMSDEVLVYATKLTKTKNIYKPTLYMLSIGVSKYENPEYNLGVADKDANSMAEMFKQQKGKIYKDVVVKTLVNRDANSDNILDGLDWIDREATSKDVVILFIAGHGVNDDKGIYYFLSHDANLERLRRTAVKWTEIQDTMSNLPSKVILIADTCHSGNITGTRRDITSAIKSIVNSGSGSVVMTATTGSGYSYEKKEWGHGAFTKSFIDGLKGMKADYDSDGTITIKEIDLYVTSMVKKLTDGKQKPTTIIPSSVPDFAIGVR
ncbi:caspase family protein [Sulfurimonas sp.]|uniref:caspase family protein n=1 Tax=Sulfurimonas sp. TaxID=2022749 RepID=UPI00356A70F5